METRLLFTTYVVNTFVDQNYSPGYQTTVSLRDALVLAEIHPGDNTIDVPAGDYKLTLGFLQISGNSGSLVVQSVGGFATLDAQSNSFPIISCVASQNVPVTLSGLIFTGASSNPQYVANGAVYNSNSTLTILNSIITGNAAAGLISSNEAVTTLTGVTISNNGVGIDNSRGNNLLAINDCTIADNQGAGVSVGTVGGVRISDSTITNNQGYGVDVTNAAYSTIGNSIIAGNGPDGDVNVLTISHGGNVIGAVGPSTGWLTSDKTGTTENPLDARLAPLGNYGGPTPTLPPVAGSPALGAGVVSAIPAGVTTDQRGLPRIVGSTVDSGAVEIQGSAKIQITPPPAQQFTVAPATVKLGSFTAAGVSGPFVADIQWGDGSPDTLLNLSSAGTIPPQLHKFAVAGILQVAVSVTDGAADLSNAAMFNATVVAHPPVSFVVNTTKDQIDAAGSATLSLRDAIARADQQTGPVSITFSPAVFASPQTIIINSNALSIGGDPYGIISITAPAAGLTLATDSGNPLTIENHAAVAFRGLDLGVSISNFGVVTLGDCFVATASDGIMNFNTLAVNDCTITGNANDGVFNSGQAVITDSTITANYDGIENASGAMVTLSNSVVAASVGDPSTTGDVSGVIQSLGHNIIGERDFSSGWIASDLTGTISHPLNPKLSPLGNYGGTTLTQYPLTGSAALGGGSVALIPTGITTDQRGFSRTFNGKVDIGAFQTQNPAAITFTPPVAQSATAGVAATISLGSIADPSASGPFLVTLTWGDGSPSSFFTVKSAGSLGTINHTFVALGNVANTIVVVDHAGNLKTSTFTVTVSAAALKTIVVNTVADLTDALSSTTVSLRDAINRADAAFGPVNITFSPTVFAAFKTIQLASSIPDLAGNHFGAITFVGPAAGVSIKSLITYGNNGHGEPVPQGNDFNIDAGIAASFSNITFTQLGFRSAGYLTLLNSTISGNSVVGFGAGIFNTGTLTLRNSTLTNNTAIVDSSPGGEYGGYGGGIENRGTMTIVNCTISGNSAGFGGAGIDNNGIAFISDSTISANSSQTAGGIINDLPSAASRPKVTLANTIVSGNIATSDVFGPFISAGYNLIGEKNDGAGWVASDLTGTIAHPLNAKLSPLGNYGGPTQTMVPLATSPAIGSGSVSLIPAGVTTDQRGLPRVIGGKVDIGSVEINKGGPFFGAPAPFGRIQAENFDFGGQNVAYFDPSNNNLGGQYRPSEGVGIGTIPGGYFVGYTQPGEWIDYTVNVAATATYTLNFRVASGVNGSAFHLNVDGVNVTGSLAIPNKGWNTYTIVAKTGVHLTAGTHVLRLMIDSKNATQGNGNFDWFEAVKT